MKFTINSQSQPIFPFGQQTALVVTNKGPFPVFLDDNTSVSVDEGLQLDPTATIVWDEDKPLYMVASGDSSSVVINRNSVASDASRAGVFTNLFSLNSLQLTTNSSGPIIPFIDVSAFNSLLFTFRHDFSLAISTINYINIEFQWYSAAGLEIARDDVQFLPLINPPLSSATKFPITIPVKAQYLVVAIAGHASPATPTTITFQNIQLYGTKRDLPFSVDRSPFKPAISSTLPEWVNNYPEFPNYGSDYVGIDTYDFQPMWLNNKGYTTLSGEIRASTSVTTQGEIQIQDAFSNGRHLARVLIPVASGAQNYPFSLRVPISYPIKIDGTAPVGPANNRLLLWWSD